MEQHTTQQPAQNLNEILQIRRDKLTALQQAGQDPFIQTRYDFDTTTAEIRGNFDQMENTSVRLAGRMMSKRVMGKVSFCDLQDSTGRLQLYVRRDELGEEAYAQFKKFDIGDIIGVAGTVFRTQRGEIFRPLFRNALQRRELHDHLIIKKRGRRRPFSSVRYSSDTM